MPEVSIVKCKEISKSEIIEKALLKAISLIGGFSSKILRNDSVLIKPNILSDRDFTSGATTNPYVIEALINILREYGIKNIIIGEGSIVGKDTGKAFKKCGIDRLADNKKVKLVDLKKDDFIPLSVSNGKILKMIKLPKSIVDADFIINIPAMKTHDSFPATLGLKNMKGIIREQDKKRFHLWGLAQCIVDLNKVAMPHLTIIDGTVGMEGAGPLSGDPVDLGVLIASFDTVAADMTAARVMGIEPDSIKYLKLAIEQNLGTTKELKIEIKGEKIEKVKKKFRQAELDFEEFKKYGIKVIEEGACSGCKHTMETFLIKSEARNQLKNIRDCSFIMGQNVKLPRNLSGRIFKFGSCTKVVNHEGAIYIPGCPPHMDIIRDVLKRKAGHHQ